MLNDVLRKAVELGAADVFLVAGIPITYKVKGTQVKVDSEIMKPSTIEPLVNEIYTVAGRSRDVFDDGSDDDFSFAMTELGRFRVNVFRQRGSVAAVIRVIKFGIPDPASIAGKSTTLACMIDRINKTRENHIITMEDPIEYVHRHNKSIVSQREIFIDTPGYLESLRSALRESPDVILLGEMRDYDTISAAITAAETGILLLSTLHTHSAANTINRIIDVFESRQQTQVRAQLSQLLKGVVCQQLVPTVDGRLEPVFEIMKQSPAIQNMIREGKLHQLDSAMQAARSDGMITMDESLLELYAQKKITRETLLGACNNYEFVARKAGI